MWAIIYFAIFYQYERKIYIYNHAFVKGDSVYLLIQWKAPSFPFFEKESTLNVRCILRIKGKKVHKEKSKDIKVLITPGDSSMYICDEFKISLPLRKKYSCSLLLADRNSDEKIEEEFKVMNFTKYVEEFKPVNLCGELYERGESLQVEIGIKNVDSLLLYLYGDNKNLLGKYVVKSREVMYFPLKEGTSEYRFVMKSISQGKIVEKYENKVYIPMPFWYSDTQYKKMVGYLIYVASDRERKELLSLPVDKRKEGWEEFWKKHDPTPLTPRNEFEEEYMRRVFYAEEHFSFGDKGYKSERGKVYIKLGPPDEVESHPFDIDTRPYEIWYYYDRGIKFIFMDINGFGEYRIIYPKGVKL